MTRREKSLSPPAEAAAPPDIAPKAMPAPGLGACLLDMSRIASGWGRGTAAILLRTASEGLAHRKPPNQAPPPGLVRLVYVSRPTSTELGLAAARAAAILETAQRHNAAHGLTGALLSSRRWFAQVLEGDAAAVESLYARIQADPRHCEVRLLSLRPIRSRSFSGWAMANAGEAPERLIRHLLDDVTAGGSGQKGLREMLVLMRGRLRAA